MYSKYMYRSLTVVHCHGNSSLLLSNSSGYILTGEGFVNQLNNSVHVVLAVIKHLMTGPKGNSEFCFPETRNIKG